MGFGGGSSGCLLTLRCPPTQMRKNCLAEARLKLKEGAQVMCIKNLNVGAGVCNGSKGVVIGFTPPDEEAPPGSSAGRQGWPIVRFANDVEQVSSSQRERAGVGWWWLCGDASLPFRIVVVVV